jgi:predicted dehydrogenase
MSNPRTARAAEASISERRRVNRRDFLKTGAAASGFWIAGRQLGFGQEKSPNAKLNVAVIGVGGMRGADNTAGVSTETLYAFCDIDEKNLAKAKQKHPDAKEYHDFRVMLEKEPQLDAIVISTPDHIHAVAGVMAMKMGKHVYTEKPMAHSVFEVRTMVETARKHKVATQMGTQIHAGPNYRRVVELIQSGAIGKVKEVHVFLGPSPWTAGDLPADTPDCPKHLHWDLWLGPAQERKYHPEFHPINWRKWWNFAGGPLADMACHHMDLPFWALGLKNPKTIEAQGPPVHAEGAPPWLTVTWDFDGLPLTWYHGDKRPPHFSDGRIKIPWGGGNLFVGDKGMLLANYGQHKLLPEDQYKDFKPPEKTIPDSIGHHAEFIRAAKGGDPALCRFDYAGPLTEAVLLGNVAYRCGKKFEWDSAALKTKGCPEADRLLQREYRKGWSL